jgi:hypothetical protein
MLIDVKNKPSNQSISDEVTERNKNFQAFAITSVISGPVAAAGILTVLFFALSSFGVSPANLSKEITCHAWIVYTVYLISWVGLISGTIGLKSNKKKSAIVGIILCAMLLILSILLIVGTDYGFYLFN